MARRVGFYEALSNWIVVGLHIAVEMPSSHGQITPRRELRSIAIHLIYRRIIGHHHISPVRIRPGDRASFSQVVVDFLGVIALVGAVMVEIDRRNRPVVIATSTQ